MATCVMCHWPHPTACVLSTVSVGHGGIVSWARAARQAGLWRCAKQPRPRESVVEQVDAAGVCGIHELTARCAGWAWRASCTSSGRLF